MFLVGVVVRRYIDFLIILLNPIYSSCILYLLFFAAAPLLFSFFFYVFRSCNINQWTK